MNKNSLFFKTITSQSKTIIIINNGKICYSDNHSDKEYEETSLDEQCLDDFLLSFLGMNSIYATSHRLSEDSAVVVLGELDHSEKECELFYIMMHRANLILSNRIISLIIGYNFLPTDATMKRLNGIAYPESETAFTELVLNKQQQRSKYLTSSADSKKEVIPLRLPKASWFSLRTALAMMIVFGIVLTVTQTEALNAFFCKSALEVKYKNFEFEAAESCNNDVLNNNPDDFEAKKWKLIIHDAKEHLPLLYPTQVQNEKINDIADYLFINNIYALPTSELMNGTTSEKGMKIYTVSNQIMMNASNSVPYNNTSIVLLVDAKNTSDDKENYYSLLDETIPFIDTLVFNSTADYIQSHETKPRSSLVLHNIVYERDNENSRALMGLANTLLDLESLRLEKMYYKDELKLDIENITKYKITNGFYKLVEEIYRDKPADNGVPQSIIGQATVLLKEGKLEDAIMRYEDGKKLCEFEAEELRRDKFDASCVINALAGMGHAYLRNENNAKANKIFEDVIMRDPENISAVKGLAFVHLFDGDATAKEKFIEVLNKKPNILYSIIDDANFFIIKNINIDKIDFLYNSILLDIMPNNLAVIDGKGFSLLQTNRVAEALSYYEEKFEVYPKVVDIVLGYADALYKDGQHTAALEKYLDVQQLDPENERIADIIKELQDKSN